MVTVKKIAILVGATSLALIAYLGIGSSRALAWPCAIPGRMTGGGSVCEPAGCRDIDGGGRVTEGFELHCKVFDLPNNLEINDHIGNNRFHLDSLDQVVCFFDPSFDPTPPPAGFNTYVGEGTGSWNGVPGFCAEWTFTDAGGNGKNDTASILITDAPFAGTSLCDAFLTSTVAGSCTGHILLQIGPANLTFGDFQAHNDNH